LGRLWEALHLQNVVGPLSGVVSLDLPFRLEGPEWRPVGTGRFEVRDLRWGGTELASSLVGSIRLTGDGLQFRHVAGTIAGGTLRTTISLALGRAGPGWFTLSLEGAETSQLLAPFPSLTGLFQGPLDLRLRGSLGRHWNGGGQVVLSHGKVFGVEVSEGRLPLR